MKSEILSLKTIIIGLSKENSYYSMKSCTVRRFVVASEQINRKLHDLINHLLEQNNITH